MAGENEFEIQFFERILQKSPKDIDVIEILGGLYSRNGRVDDGLKMDRKLVRLKPDNPTAHYNLACSLALKRRKSDAVKSLKTAIELGYDDADWLRNDPDLECLQDHPVFQQLLEELENSQIER